MTSPTSDELAERACAAHTDRFGAALVPHVARFDRLLTARTAHLPGVDLDSVRRDAAAQAAAVLTGLSVRTLLHDFHSAAGTLDDLPDGDRRYRAHHRELSTPAGRRRLGERYPGWAAFTGQVLRRRATALAEALARTVDRGPQLRDRLGAGRTVVGLHGNLGDSHRGGRSVVVMRTEARPVVYKPRSLEPERVLGAVLHRLSGHLPPDHRVRVPRVVTADDHGWQEFTPPRPCDDAGQVRDFHTRVGVLLAALHVLGTSDVHHENLIAAGDEPLLVDLEVLVRRTGSDDGDLPAALDRALSSSVLQTMVLPMNYVGGTFDIDVGALGVPVAQSSEQWRSQLLVDEGTDRIRLESRPTPVVHTDNVVRLDGRAVDPRDHDEDVVAGFHRAWDVLARHAEEVLDPVEEAVRCGVGVPVRQVLRPTALYARFALAATHPDHLERPGAREALFARLGPVPGFDAGDGARLHRAEVRDLLRGDVPCFTLDLAGGPLSGGAGGTGGVRPDAPPLVQEVLRRRRTLTSPHGRTRQEHLVRTALMTSGDRAWDAAVVPGRAAADAFTDPAPEAVARRVGDLLLRTAVWSGDGRCAWPMAKLAEGERLRLGRSEFSWFEGGAIPQFLHALAAATGGGEYRRTAVAALADLHDDPGRWVGELRSSAFTGAVSVLEVAVHGQAGRGDLARLVRAVDLPGRTADALGAVVPGADPVAADLLGGLAGLVTAWVRLHAARPDAVPAPDQGLAGRAAVLLLDHPGDGSGSLAHGRAGTLLGAAAAAAAAGGDLDGPRRRARELARRLGTGADGLPRDRRARASWCRGLPGAVQGAAHALLAVGVPADEVRAELDAPLAAVAAVAARPGTDLSVCHGSAGPVAVLADLATVLHDPALRGAARTAAGAATALVRRRGWTGGVRRSSGLTSGFLGITGFGQALLAAAGAGPATSLPVGIRPAVAGTGAAAAVPERATAPTRP